MNQIFHVTFPGLGWNFTLNPVAFQIGSLTVRWYGVIIATGFLLAFLYAMKSAPRFGFDPDKLIDCIIVGLVAGIVGARLYYVIFAPDDRYINDPISIFYINEGGLAIYGGVIGGLVGGVLMAKIRKLRIFAVLDVAVIGFLIGQAIGRWGNFMNQEAFGTETTLPWRMVSEGTQYAAVHPCFLYESLWCAVGFVLLHIYSKNYRRYDGQIFWLYLVWYGAERFFVEGLRTDSLYLIGLNIRVSQMLAILTALVGVFFLIRFRKCNTLCVNEAADAPDKANIDAGDGSCDCESCTACTSEGENNAQQKALEESAQPDEIAEDGDSSFKKEDENK